MDDNEFSVTTNEGEVTSLNLNPTERMGLLVNAARSNQEVKKNGTVLAIEQVEKMINDLAFEEVEFRRGEKKKELQLRRDQAAANIEGNPELKSLREEYLSRMSSREE